MYQKRLEVQLDAAQTAQVTTLPGARPASPAVRTYQSTPLPNEDGIN